MKAHRIALWGSALIVGCVLGAIRSVNGEPIPGINRILPASIFSKSGSTETMRAATVSTGGYMTAAQASDLAFVLAGGLPTPTPLPDPLTVGNLVVVTTENIAGTSTWVSGINAVRGGDVYAMGDANAIGSDTFTRANTVSLVGLQTQTGGLTYSASFQGSLSIISNAAVCPAGQSGHGWNFNALVNVGVADFQASVDMAISTNVQSGGLMFRTDGGTTNGWVAGYIAPNFCIEHFDGSGAVCSNINSAGSGTMIVTASGNTITASWRGHTVTTTDSYQNTQTLLGPYHTGDGTESFTNFVVTTDPIPPEFIVRGDYTDAAKHATIAMGEGAGGIDIDIPDGTGTVKIHDAAVLGSSLSVAGASSVTTISASGQITSTVATGSAPYVVASVTKVANLNVDLLDGFDSSAFAAAPVAVTVRKFSSSLTPGIIAPGSTTDTNFSVSGLTAWTDECVCSPPSTPPAGLSLPQCVPSSATNLLIRYVNPTGSGVTAPAGTYSCTVFQY